MMDQSLAAFQGRVALVGAGHMGGAMLAGWLKNGLSPYQVTVIDPRPPEVSAALMQQSGVRLNPTEREPHEVVVIAVKPQVADDVMAFVRPFVGRNTAIVSVMAGKTIQRIGSIFGAGHAIIRTIPNTPAAVGRGITAATANEFTTEAQKQVVNALLSAVGKVEWLSDENLIDAVTAVSGSGPAYAFYLTECMAEAGAKMGLPRDLAERLARATVEGAGELMYRQPALSASRLRENVTSPAGTTFAALEVLTGDAGLDGGLQPLIDRAVQAATKRSGELAG